MKILVYLLLLTLASAQRAQNFDVPKPIFEALSPKGFRVSLADNGYSFVGFRGNLNREFKGLSEGEFNKDIVKANDGQWVYKNRDIALDIGDTIFYWLYVLKDGRSQMITDQEWTVDKIINQDGSINQGSTPVNPPSQGSPPRQPQSVPTITPQGIDSRFPCVSSRTEVPGKQVCKDALIFSEEFEQVNLKDLKNWDAEVKFPGEPDYPFNFYTTDPISFEDGSLVITPKLTESQYHEGILQEALDLGASCTGIAESTECKNQGSGWLIIPPAVTAKITTRHKFSFKFGRVEIRAKLPAGSWLVPEINLESSDKTYGSKNYVSGLMHVAFARGNLNLAKKLYGGPVLSDAEPFRSALLEEKIGFDNWNKDFHNYTMIWKTDGIDLLVDGEVYGSVPAGEGFYETARKQSVAHASAWLKGSIMAPLDQMFHIALGLRVGGVRDFSDDLPDKPWKNAASKAMLNFWNQKNSWHPSWSNSAMKIDYVRVYAL